MSDPTDKGRMTYWSPYRLWPLLIAGAVALAYLIWRIA